MKIESIRLRGLARANLKWLALAAVVGFGAYRLKFAPVPVVAHQITTGPLVAEVMGTGALGARVKTTISSHIQEPLAEVLVDQNDCVAAGQLLARLDDSELKRQVEVAEAGLAAARATLERVKADEARAVASEKLARLNYERESELLPTKSTSQQDFDTAEATLQNAEADVKRAQAATTEAERQATSADKTRSYQMALLAFTPILSPYNGLIVRRELDPGSIALPGSSILQLISTNEIWVSAWVDETAMAALAPGQPARIVFRSEPEKSFPGKVARLGREVDTETREFDVDVDVTVLPRNWALGQRAEVYIQTGRAASVLALPAKFLLWREGRPGVFVNDHGRARWRDVQLGLRGLEAVEVVAGLSAGEQVVATVMGENSLALDGRGVRVLPGVQPANKDASP
ncbi:MAG TPA: efflux RND transporter periplasmic adaptor subunit [Verrucomicrobiae bacterium]|nr:efflux RND transporter periplasmic adaptor subunit [Verrucomicrobiae bacterium]